MRNRSQQTLLAILPYLRSEDFDLAREELGRKINTDDAWTSCAHEAGHHRLLGYLAYLAQDQPRLPSFARDQAQRTYDGIRMRYEFQCMNASDVASLLCDLPVVLLKGIAVAIGAHSLPQLRTSGDLDFLVAPSAFLKAMERLVREGFQFQPGQHFPWPLPRWLEKTSKPLEIDEVVLHRHQAVLEIHPTLVSFKLPHEVQVSEVLENRVAMTLPKTDTVFYRLSNEDTWLHLAMNHHLHRFQGGLGMLLDLAKWEDRNPLHLQTLQHKIEAWKIDYLVYPVLAQLKSLFPDLPTVEALGEKTPPLSNIFHLADHARNSTATPWFWITQSPTPVKSLFHNLFPSATTAALRYGIHPYDPRLWFRRAWRPMELWRRHRHTLRRKASRS